MTLNFLSHKVEERLNFQDTAHSHCSIRRCQAEWGRAGSMKKLSALLTLVCIPGVLRMPSALAQVSLTLWSLSVSSLCISMFCIWLTLTIHFPMNLATVQYRCLTHLSPLTKSHFLMSRTLKLLQSPESQCVKRDFMEVQMSKHFWSLKEGYWAQVNLSSWCFENSWVHYLTFPPPHPRSDLLIGTHILCKSLYPQWGKTNCFPRFHFR